jgi:hypothetical protein
MHPVAVRILHPAATPATGVLESALIEARALSADGLAERFRAAGTDDVSIEAGGALDMSFGARLRGLVAGLPADAGLVVLGSGSIPLATARDVGDLIDVAGSGERRAITNNRYSADAVALGGAAALAAVPDLATDNELPRWLAESAGYHVHDLRRRWRLGVDLDSPLDVLLTRGRLRAGIDTSAVSARLERLRILAADTRAELVAAGRTSGWTLRWLERRTASRTRALIEERGLRASRGAASRGAARLPRSVLGLVLDDRGPAALGRVLAELGDGAIVDSRVLLAHRLGADERRWPPAEDRFASDLLLPELIGDAWLRALTDAARDAPIPVLLGGHTLVGPGLRLVLAGRR